MTFKFLKDVTTGLLTGDNVLPKQDDVVIGLLGYAYNQIATRAEALHLLTLSNTADILRLAPGDYYTRTPELPEKDTDILDIDDKLVYVAARFIASYVSKSKGEIHLREAKRLILDYNSKVYEILETMELNKKKDTCDV